MYKKFYGFKEKPFNLIPNPTFLYHSKKHQNALTYLEYGLSEGSGFILLTGDIGAGKTTVIRYILDRIEDNIGIEVALISNTNVDSGELVDLILHEFGLESAADSKAKSLDAIFRFLVGEYSRGKRVLLVIDEAQNLSIQALEEIRMLSNLQTDDQLLLQIILVGQPELKRRLNTAALTQLSQRISVFYHLGAMDRDEIEEYIAFRLEKAGGAPDIFADDTFDLIYEASGGIPRIINILCDTALVYGYAESLNRISAEVVAQVIRDKEGLGLRADERIAGNLPPAGEEAAGADDQSPRLLDLEQKVADLQQQMDWRLADIDRRGMQANERLITQLTELLRDERGKTDKLLLEYERLRAGAGLVNAGTADEGTPAAHSEQAEAKPFPGAAESGGDAGQQEKSKDRTERWFQRILHSM